MKPRDSLRRRIAVAYLLFAFGITLFLALIAALAVEGIEEHLVDDRLKEVATWASPRHASGLPVGMPAGLSFHHGASIPASLRGFAPGVREVNVDGVGLHVLSGKDSAGAFVVVDHESDYEKVELVVYSLFALAFAGILLFSLFLGRFIGSRVVTPILDLAGSVGKPADDALLERGDELGMLARALAAHTTEMRGFLDRERFFTGDVSHELRTPLTVIKGAAEILLEQHGGNPNVAAPAERVLRAANEAAECINVLLMLARGPARLPRPETDIGTIASREVARFQSLVAEKPVTLSYAGGTSFTIPASAELCSSAIGNLVRNACQYTQQGAVVVRMEGRSVIVDDSGPGLPAAVLGMLNGAAADLREGSSSGSGLGLALVKRICEYLGAQLSVRPRDGGGTVFEIRFAVDLTRP